MKLALVAICLYAPMATLPKNPPPKCGPICAIKDLGGHTCVVEEWQNVPHGSRKRLAWCDYKGDVVELR